MMLICHVLMGLVSMCFAGGEKDRFGLWRWERGTDGSCFSGSS